jgi:cysteine desulfurase / selenocysteine lyase
MLQTRCSSCGTLCGQVRSSDEENEMSIDVNAVREHFPFVAEWNYLNHATHGPFPVETAQAIADLAAKWQSPAALDHGENQQTVDSVRKMIGRLVNGSADSVAFTGSLAESISLAACGIDWQDGDNCVIPGHEFPSVVYPFLNLGHRGVEVRFASRGASGFTDLDEIRALMDNRTRAVAISYVEFSDGYRNDLASLSQLCRDNDALLIVDVTQALGPCVVDVAATGVDVIAAHSYKWLMASYGVGVTWLSERAIERIRPTYGGRLMVKQGFEDQSFRLDLRDGAARYQTGGLNWITLAGLETSLKLIRSLPTADIVSHTVGLTDRVLDGVERKGYRVMSCREPERRSAIVAFTSGDRERDDALVKDLEQARISVALRNRGIRVSPYFYNTADEVDAFLEALPENG